MVALGLHVILHAPERKKGAEMPLYLPSAGTSRVRFHGFA